MASWSRSVATVIGRAPIGRGAGGPLAPRLGHCSDARRYPPGDAAHRDPAAPARLPGATVATAPPAPAAPTRRAPRIVVLGDLMLDVVLAPSGALEVGTDVPGPRRAASRAARRRTPRAGSAGSGARSTPHHGGRARRRRPGAGRGASAPTASRRGSCASRAPGPAGSACSSRPAASAPSWPTAAPPTGSRPDDLQAAWFDGADALHLPVYSLLGEPLGQAGRRAIELARAAGRARQRRPRVDRAAAGATAGASARALDRGGRPGPPVRHRLRGGGAPRRPRRRRVCSSSRRSPSSSAGRRARPCWPAPATAAPRFEVATEHRRRRPTRPAPATRSTPGSSSAGSRRGPPGGRCRRRSSARRSPATAPPRASCRRRGRSCRSA